MKKEIKLQTAQGEQVFPLEKQDVNTEPIEEGATVTVELNEEAASSAHERPFPQDHIASFVASIFILFPPVNWFA